MSAKSLPVRKAPGLSLLGKQISPIQNLASTALGMGPVPRGAKKQDGSARLGAQGRQGPGAAATILPPCEAAAKPNGETQVLVTLTDL